MKPHSHNPRRLRAVGAGLAAAALLAGSALTANADEMEDNYLGSAADFGQAATVPSLEEQLAHYGESVLDGRWLVELEGTNANRLVSDARKKGLEVQVRDTYSQAWNGVSIELDSTKAASLSQVRGVKGVYPVVEFTQPVEPDATPAVEYAKQLTGANYVNDELGFTGDGIKVAIIDSGIDYNHPDFGGSGVNDETRDFPNDRVAYGYDFVGDAYDASSDDPAVNTPRPDRFPDDCGGHGTHVAGIVGANGEIQGVAPDVTFGAYRVFGCDGSSSSDVIMAAMEMAVADGMDVINMSLGASFVTWPSYPTAVAADRIVEDHGVVVVVSQGNSGVSGTFSGGAPAVAHNVISVGSVDNTDFMGHYVSTPARLEVPYMSSTGSPNFEAGVTYEITAADPILGCPANPPAEATGEGQALLVQRGSCTFHEKALTAQQAGYDALFIFNNTSGIINATVEGDTEITIPVATTLQADGEALLAEINASGGSVEIVTSEEPMRFDNPTGGYQSDFSSYGLAADLTLKPDVSAPGGSIYSTYPLEEGGYATQGGTSMAAPHVAGAVALLLEAKPDLDPFEVRRTLSNTADPYDWSLVPRAGFLEPVHRQGAGMVDIPQAIQTAISIEPGKISLGEGEHGPVTTTVTVTNDGETAQTYTVGVQHGVATAVGTFANPPGDPVTFTPANPGFFILNADVEFSADTITVPAGASATFTAVIGESFDMDGAIYGGWITLTSGSEDFVVPFAGLSGDYQALRALTTALLAYVEDGALYVAQPFHEYSMEGDDMPVIYFQTQYPTSALYFDIYRANPDGTKGARVHNNFMNYATIVDQGRFPNAVTLTWDGTYQGNNGNDKMRRVDYGDYVLELRVLKALGDPGNPDHWEVWNSPAFTINYGPDADTSAEIGPEPRRPNPNQGNNGNGNGNNGRGNR